MPLEFIYLNSLPVVAVNCDNRKAMGKEKWHKVKFEKFTKNDSIEFTKKKKNKTKANRKKPQKNKQTNKQQKKRQNGNQILNQQLAKM